MEACSGAVETSRGAVEACSGAVEACRGAVETAARSPARPDVMVTMVTIVTMVTMGGDLQPGCLADQLLNGLGQPQINP